MRLNGHFPRPPMRFKEPRVFQNPEGNPKRDSRFRQELRDELKVVETARAGGQDPV